MKLETLINSVINSYIKIKNSEINNFQSIVYSAIDFIEGQTIINNQLSVQYNPLFYFNIPEPLNSRILTDLLNPSHNHGQGDLFLSEYLKYFGIEYNDSESWKVERESENADIVLSASNPLRVVVIENKINNAPQYYQFPGEEEHQNRLSKLGHPMLPGFSEMHIRIPLNRCGPITTVYFTANMECQLVYEDGV